MSNKQRIALLISSLNSGGMEKVICDLANYFCTKDSLEIHLVVYGTNSPFFYKPINGVIVHQTKYDISDSNKLIHTIKTLLFIRKTVKNIKAHSVLSFGEYWNNLVIISLLFVNIPIYVSDRCRPNIKLHGINERLRKFLYKFAHGIIVQTECAKNIYSNIFPKNKLYVVPNPIKVNSFDLDSIRENIVLSVGRLIPSKHHEQLIDIFTEINNPEWRLVIVGGNALKNNRIVELEAQIRANGMEGKIFLVGEQKDVEKYYNTSKIFAFTSSSEGFPNVIGEAMSYNLPIVTYDCIAGPKEMIEDGINGFLIPLFNQKQFILKLQMLMENELLIKSMGNKSSVLIKKYDFEVIANKFLTIISN